MLKIYAVKKQGFIKYAMGAKFGIGLLRMYVRLNTYSYTISL